MTVYYEKNTHQTLNSFKLDSASKVNSSHWFHFVSKSFTHTHTLGERGKKKGKMTIRNSSEIQCGNIEVASEKKPNCLTANRDQLLHLVKFLGGNKYKINTRHSFLWPRRSKLFRDWLLVLTVLKECSSLSSRVRIIKQEESLLYVLHVIWSCIVFVAFTKLWPWNASSLNYSIFHFSVTANVWITLSTIKRVTYLFQPENKRNLKFATTATTITYHIISMYLAQEARAALLSAFEIVS